MAVFLGFLTVLSLLRPESNPTGLFGVILVAQIRRLHDFGRSGWWAAGLQAAQLVVAVALLPLVSMDTVLTIGGIVALGGIVLVGIVPGDPLPNRFGPAPGRPSLKETFD